MKPLHEAALEIAGRYYQVPPRDLFERKTSKNIVGARKLAMYLVRVSTALSFPEIGALFKRDHTTVMSAVRSVTQRRVTDKPFDETVESMVAGLTGLDITRVTDGVGLVTLRSVLVTKLQERLATGLYGASLDDFVDRIVCDYLQRKSDAADES